jgi:hypothetical protein
MIVVTLGEPTMIVEVVVLAMMTDTLLAIMTETTETLIVGVIEITIGDRTMIGRDMMIGQDTMIALLDTKICVLIKGRFCVQNKRVDQNSVVFSTLAEFEI